MWRGCQKKKLFYDVIPWLKVFARTHKCPLSHTSATHTHRRIIKHFYYVLKYFKLQPNAPHTRSIAVYVCVCKVLYAFERVSVKANTLRCAQTIINIIFFLFQPKRVSWKAEQIDCQVFWWFFIFWRDARVRSSCLA